MSGIPHATIPRQPTRVASGAVSWVTSGPGMLPVVGTEVSGKVLPLVSGDNSLHFILWG